MSLKTLLWKNVTFNTVLILSLHSLHFPRYAWGKKKINQNNPELWHSIPFPSPNQTLAAQLTPQKHHQGQCLAGACRSGWLGWCTRLRISKPWRHRVPLACLLLRSGIKQSPIPSPSRLNGCRLPVLGKQPAANRRAKKTEKVEGSRKCTL